MALDFPQHWHHEYIIYLPIFPTSCSTVGPNHQLIARDSSGLRLIGAAGEVEVSGSTLKFPGLSTGVGNGLPDISGSTISFFQPGQEPTKSPLIIGTGSWDSATITGSPPQGTLSYRLTAPRPSVSVQLSVVGDASSGEVVVTLASPITNPSRFRGSSLLISSASWLILEATSTTVRIRVGNTLPSLGAATLLGPEPPVLEGQWAPTGEPVAGSDLQHGFRSGTGRRLPSTAITS
jgi:hypothetical protein